MGERYSTIHTLFEEEFGLQLIPGEAELIIAEYRRIARERTPAFRAKRAGNRLSEADELLRIAVRSEVERGRSARGVNEKSVFPFVEPKQ